ncbi:hypothetical protein GCM10022214_38210 [Actinomadura miaoliensis]|uniref:Uncharacterized protein n=1 Tax=Actinomadura miaoliensis TaxID=430685 RepID=A0ABP7VZV2_9ACTN
MNGRAAEAAAGGAGAAASEPRSDKASIALVVADVMWCPPGVVEERPGHPMLDVLRPVDKSQIVIGSGRRALDRGENPTLASQSQDVGRPMSLVPKVRLRIRLPTPHQEAS